MKYLTVRQCIALLVVLLMSPKSVTDVRVLLNNDTLLKEGASK